MRRALLLFNPEATSVSPRVRDVIAHALAAELKLDVVGTKRRHHATHLAAGAAHEGYEVVVCLGGDGTLNEVVNGLVGTDVPIIPLPGGGTNVFARTLGLPKDPVEATSVVLERLHSGVEPRRIPLGRVNGRHFAFCAGVGLDAAIVRSVERRFRLKRRIGEWFFVAQGFRTALFVYPRRDRPITVRAPGRELEGMRGVVVCNSDPFTFLGSRPFRLCPDASHDRALDATALASLGIPTALRVIARAFAGGSHVRMRSVHALGDLDSFTVECERPLPYQVDGDYAGEGARFEFSSVPDALWVLV